MQPTSAMKRLSWGGLAAALVILSAGCGLRDRPDRAPADVTISSPTDGQVIEEAETTAEQVCERLGEDARLRQDYDIQEGDVRVATFDCVEEE